MGISTHCNQILLGSFSQITHDNPYGIKINWSKLDGVKVQSFYNSYIQKLILKKQERSMAHRLKPTFSKALK